jgi:hypothetical protein
LNETEHPPLVCNIDARGRQLESLHIADMSFDSIIAEDVLLCFEVFDEANGLVNRNDFPVWCDESRQVETCVSRTAADIENSLPGGNARSLPDCECGRTPKFVLDSESNNFSVVRTEGVFLHIV